MEQKLVRVPFSVDMAKKITSGELYGNIIDNTRSYYRIVCFDLLDDKGKLIGLRKNSDFTETAFTFNDNGCCVQNTSRELSIEVPEYITFKEGDLIAYGNGDLVLFKTHIFDRKCYQQYAVLSNGKLEIGTSACMVYYDSRIANEEERNTFINALKASKEKKAKEYLKKFFEIEQKPECEFKPFDRVLVRDLEIVLGVLIFSHT